jgi:glyceraldehyde-3-phosphate dehydrogenase/erythrose-4-phosphate dehydrogenase
MFKKILATFLLASTLLVSSCTTNNSLVTPKTPREYIAYAFGLIIVINNTTDTLLNQKVITPQVAQGILVSTSTIKDELILANQYYLSNKTDTANTLVQGAITALNNLNNYLVSVQSGNTKAVLPNIRPITNSTNSTNSTGGK